MERRLSFTGSSASTPAIIPKFLNTCHIHENFIHGFRRRKVSQECIHATAQSTKNRSGNQVKPVHYLFGYPFHDAVKNTHESFLLPLTVPFSVCEEGSDISKDEAQTIENYPGNSNSFQPGTGFIYSFS